jgi:hypothetical protein
MVVLDRDRNDVNGAVYLNVLLADRYRSRADQEPAGVSATP